MVIVYFQTIAGTFVKRVVLVSWNNRSYEQKLFFVVYFLRIFEASKLNTKLLCGVYTRLIDSGWESKVGRQRHSTLALQSQRQGDAKQVSSKQTQTYCCKMSSNCLPVGRSRKSSLFHAWQYLSWSRKNVFPPWQFLLLTKKLVKNSCWDLPKFLYF